MTDDLEKFEEVKKVKRNKIKVLFLLILIGVVGLGIFVYLKNKAVDKAVDKENTYSTDIHSTNMQKIFTISEYDDINDYFKAAILNLFKQNNFLDGAQFFTKIPSRAKKVIAYGNFSNKKKYNGPEAAHEEDFINDDIAFVLEKYDFKSSYLYIMAENGDLLYYKEFGELLPTISSFKKGTKIFINKRVLENSPSDGILIFTESSKSVLLYNPETNIFEIHYQYTKEELEYEKYEGNDYENEEVITDSLKTEAKAIVVDSIK